MTGKEPTLSKLQQYLAECPVAGRTFYPMHPEVLIAEAAGLIGELEANQWPSGKRPNPVEGFSGQDVKMVWGSKEDMTIVRSAMHSLSIEGGLRTDLRHWREECGKLHAQLRTAEAFASSQAQLLAEAKEVVKFYANPDTYAAISLLVDAPAGEFADDFGPDDDPEYQRSMPGKRARAFLSTLEPGLSHDQSE